MSLKQVEAKAKKAMKQGNATLAIELFTAILKQYPGHKFARKNLKKLQKANPGAADRTKNDLNALIKLYEAGQMAAAVLKGKEMLKARPDLKAVRNIIGAALIGQGKAEEALLVFDDIVAKHPDDPEAHNNRGIALRDMGDYEAARLSYTRAIELKGDYAEAYSNRGAVCHDLGDLEAAVADYDRAIALKPGYANAYNNRGTTLSRLNMLEAALDSFEKAIESDPSHAEAYFNLGFAYKTSGLLEEAVENYEKAVDLRPVYPEAWHNLGVALHDLGQIDIALEKFEKAVELKPDYPDAYLNHGQVLVDMGLLKDGIAVYDKALAKVTAKADLPLIYYARGVAQEKAGLRTSAVESCKQALKLAAGFGEAIRFMTTLQAISPDDTLVSFAQGLLDDPALGDTDRMHLNFALSRVYEDAGDITLSHDYLDAGNLLQKDVISYDMDEALDGLRLIRDGFRMPHLSFDIGDSPSSRPVFILGMPCTGIGLVDNILAAHSGVHAAGQLESMNKCMGLMPSELLDRDADWYDEADLADEIKTLRQRYKSNLDMFKTDLPVITDSNPMNFRWIGFILAAFPDASVIHMTRDPLATCGSIYKEYFAQAGLRFACDQDWIADYYREYQALMAFWHTQFPGKILDVSFESLTAEPDAEIEKALGFCGLSWEDACRNAYRSGVEARRDPEAWRKFDPWLTPLKTAFPG
tara:strand:- start:42 stop:2132 length:2091 start_codon:yes stop_codon:yes gene_type:complete